MLLGCVGLSLADGCPLATSEITDGCGVGQLLCFRGIQAITTDTVIAYITHDDWPNISSVSTVKPAWSEATLRLVFLQMQ